MTRIALALSLLVATTSLAHAQDAPEQDVATTAGEAGVDPAELAAALDTLHQAGYGDVAPVGYLCTADGLLCPAPPPKVTTATVWDRIAECESGGLWSANTRNGYFGGLQEDMTFWREYGGLAFAPRPDLASREQQIRVAARGLSVQSWKAWPTCSRRLGLR